MLLTGGVSRGVSTLMVAVQSDIQTQVLSQIMIVTIPEHIGVITCTEEKQLNIYRPEKLKKLTNKVEFFVNGS